MHADLKARLYELELEKRAETLNASAPKTEIGFGNQIRSYVLYPYQMVKDLRSGVETSNVDSVLEDGDLDPFIIGYHRSGRPSRRSSGCIVFVRLPLLATHRGKGLGCCRKAAATGASARFICRGAYR